MGGVFVALLCALLSFPWTVAAATPAAAPADTSSVTSDDPWLDDADALLRAGYAPPTAGAPDLPSSDAVADTVTVTAPRLRVSELVRLIGERMRDDERRLGAYAVTAISRTEIFHDDHVDTLGHRTVVSEAVRINVDRDGERRTARLRRAEREYEDGQLKKDKLDTEIDREWSEEAGDLAMDMPFLLTSGGRYRYEILERKLIDGHLLFAIGFEPRDRFSPGIAGTVWIDYGDLVIRRMDGRLAGPSPAPLIVADVPRFTWKQRQQGDHWVSDEFEAEIVLRNLPLLPNRVTARVRLQDWDIGGAGAAEEP
ncbi:MAG: hypothetical protein Q7W56_01080 [Candidatus Latescibacteria bacterium]|nr:hypothetical protein [Candidatus Latescibacterota bacterium]